MENVVQINPNILADALSQLANLGFKIIKIKERYYIFTVFNVATKDVLEHELKGKDISSYITTQQFNAILNAHSVQVALNAFSTYLEGLTAIHKRYHHSTEWEVWVGM